MTNDIKTKIKPGLLSVLLLIIAVIIIFIDAGLPEKDSDWRANYIPPTLATIILSLSILTFAFCLAVVGIIRRIDKNDIVMSLTTITSIVISFLATYKLGGFSENSFRGIHENLLLLIEIIFLVVVVFWIGRFALSIEKKIKNGKMQGSQLPIEDNRSYDEDKK